MCVARVAIFSVMAGWIAVLCCSLLILLCNGQKIAEYEAYWLMGVSKINPWGAHFTSILPVFSVMDGWIAEMLLCCSLLILLCNRQNIAKYEAY